MFGDDRNSLFELFLNRSFSKVCCYKYLIVNSEYNRPYTQLNVDLSIKVCSERLLPASSCESSGKLFR